MFITAGVILIICGVVGKVGAALALIPEPIIGGTLLMGLGMVASIGISGLCGSIQSPLSLHCSSLVDYFNLSNESFLI